MRVLIVVVVVVDLVTGGKTKSTPTLTNQSWVRSASSEWSLTKILPPAERLTK